MEKPKIKKSNVELRISAEVIEEENSFILNLPDFKKAKQIILKW